jgi:uncharacterized protein YceK
MRIEVLKCFGKLLGVLICTLSAGCAAVVGCSHSEREVCNGPYGGTILDARAVGYGTAWSGEPNKIHPVMRPIALLDLPLSFIFETVFYVPAWGVCEIAGCRWNGPWTEKGIDQNEEKTSSQSGQVSVEDHASE